MTPEVDLSGLKDLHLLPEPSLWPLATGWWLVLVCLLALLLCSGLIYIFWHQRPVVYACRKVKQIARRAEDDLSYLKQISSLLKRVAIATDGREKVASLSDAKWQAFLETRVDDGFTKKEAHLIAFAPYEQALKEPVRREVLTPKILNWIQKSFKNKKSS